MIDAAATRQGRGAEARPDLAALLLNLRRLDWLLLLAGAALVGYGLWAIGAITRYDVDGDPNYFLVRQGIAVAVGVVGFAVALVVDPAVWSRHWRSLFAGTVGMLTLVLVLGSVARNSKRWLDIGPFRFQPSEFGKVLLVLVLAGFLAERARRVDEGRVVVSTIALALVPALLVFVEPDIGTALVYGAAPLAVLFVAGIRWLHLTALVTLVAFAVLAVLWILPAAGLPVLKPYQKERLTSFTDQGANASDAAYNLNQSITAVGAGGVGGRGVEGATQTNLDYLPEHETDFAFASLAEQRGFVGVAVLLLLYLLVLWRALTIAASARTAFAAIAAGGILFTLLFQIFVNVGMTIGIAPITGIPLPFVSVGGSSMVTNLVALGLLQSIHLRGQTAPRRSSRRR